jgi:hypothetical protein
MPAMPARRSLARIEFLQMPASSGLGRDGDRNAGMDPLVDTHVHPTWTAHLKTQERVCPSITGKP